MSCFIVPLVQAIATSAYRKANSGKVAASKAPLMHNLPALEKMLWGGSIMLREMLTVGVPMSLVLTAVWAVWAFVRKPSLT